MLSITDFLQEEDDGAGRVKFITRLILNEPSLFILLHACADE